MSAAPERREPIDIDEFERRLRGPEPARRVEDPLAELARLVGGQNQQAAADPFAELFSDNFRKPAPPVAAPSVVPPVAPPVAPPFSHAEPSPVHAVAPEPDPFADFPDLRPLLRGGDHGPVEFQPAHEPQGYAAPHPYPESVAPSAQCEDCAEAPDLGRVVSSIRAAVRARLAERMLRLGWRRAAMRMAYAPLEPHMRLEAIGQSESGRFHLPMRMGVPGVHLVSMGSPSGAVLLAL